jgi:hypothetical protein
MPPPSGRLRPLGQPRAVRVLACDAGRPVRVRLANRWVEVRGILESWRIDDEWWREPISRAYYALVLSTGAHLTLYHDLVTDRWFESRV